MRRLGMQLVRDDVLGLSGELAYRFFLAIFPFFLLLASLGNLIASLLDVANPAQYAADFLSQAMPSNAATVFRSETGYVIAAARFQVLSLSLVGALFMATSGTNTVIKGLNRAYGVQETRPFWKRYGVAMGLTCSAGVAIMTAFLVFIWGWGIGNELAKTAGRAASFYHLMEVAHWPVSGVLLAAGVSLIYWFGPNVHVPFRWVTPGALLFTVGWLVMTAAFTRYVDRFGSYGAYGTLAGVVVLLLWLYLTALLLLVGAELNDVLDEMADHERIDSQRRGTRELAAIRQLPPSSAGTMAQPPDAA